MPADFDAYLRALAATPLDEKTEHTDRAALESLLRQAADDAEPGAHVQHEPRHDRTGKGSPDFKITRAGRIAGYVEVKQIDEALSKVLKSDQIRKYLTLTDNLVLTDYLEFIWLKPGGDHVRERLAHSEDLSARKLALKPERVAAVANLLRGFFSAAPARIGRGQDLALALARRAALLRDFLAVELQRQVKEHREGRLLGLYDSFKTQVFHDLTVGDFADAFAQTLAYGLFLARLNAGDAETVTLENVRHHIPGSFALIRELVRFLEEMNEREYADIRWVTEEVLSIVNGIELNAIHEDLSFRARKAISRKLRAGDEEEHRLFERDPFIYFYEDFLKAYDPAMRKGRGVYYTPPPVVNFIVRAVDDILKDSFGIKAGLADKNRVTVLDFACGTGTFLLEVFERVFDNIGGAQSGKAGPVVREHLTKNVFGFEYLIAPYTIAHLKLSQYLKDKGHPLEGDERLQVFLTNTLEPVEPQANAFLPALSAEAKAAHGIKQKPILVIIGNPPYSGESKNKGLWIKRLIDGYITEADGATEHFVPGYKHTFEREITGRNVEGKNISTEVSKPLGERNSKWLNDDYVKFMRFAQWKMDQVEEGVVGIITNHSWLDNPTFRAMRQSLMRSFDQIHVLDLHGNAKKKEHAPDGSKDENVFDIEQGVAISLLVKRPGLERGVWRGDLWGRRLHKYESLSQSTLTSETSLLPDLAGPSYLITSHNVQDKLEFDSLWSVTNIFVLGGTGIITKRDRLTIQFTPEEVWKTVVAFSSTPDHELHDKFRLVEDVRDWKAADAKADLIASGPSRNHLQKIHYRPFDDRYTYNTKRSRGFLGWPVPKLMDNMILGNIALITARTNKSSSPDHFSVTTLPSETKAGESTVQSYNFPLFRAKNRELIDNISPNFRTYLDARFDHHHTPEQVFGYIYAVVHAPSYRARYAEFLRIDFPRIPFPETRAAFEALSELGWALVQVHLLRETPNPDDLAGYPDKGSDAVELVSYSEQEQAVWINRDAKTGRGQRFAPVPPEVWAFRIGGYQVLDKYLKSRRGRKLSLDEINHVGAVAGALQFTLAQMKLIDAAYLAAFPEANASGGGRG